jgi:TetR/AcrR family fatty acid metabolism transcriptional regulator
MGRISQRSDIIPLADSVPGGEPVESNDKRLAILRAAAKKFSTQGFHDTKVEQIAEEAGVAKGTVYLYFKDKSHLLFEVGRYYLQQHIEQLKQQMAPHEKAVDKLRAYARYHTTHFQEIVKFHKLNFEHIFKVRQNNELTAAMRADQRKLFDLLVETVNYGIEQNEFREVDPTDAALLVSGALQSYVFGTSIGAIEKKPLTHSDTLIDLLVSGLGKKA